MVQVNSKAKKDVDVMKLVATDAPMPISVAAMVYGIDKAKLKHATDVFKSSRGKMGLRCFTLPGSKKLRVRASAVKDWFAMLEEQEAF